MKTADYLDGDHATVSSAKVTVSASGTAPFDKDDKAGNDSSKTNSVIRSYDTATWDVEYVTTPDADSPYQYFKSARVALEATVEGDATKIGFDLDAMAWADRTKGYEPKVETRTSGGRTYQVLTAWRLLKPDANNPTTVPGSGHLSLAVAVKGMTQGQRVAPTVRMWAEHNQPARYRTAQVPALTVSSAPRFDVKIAARNEMIAGRGAYDFATGSADAPNRSRGKVNGMASAIAWWIAIDNANAEKRMRGVELPDGSPMTFTVDVQSSFKAYDATKWTDVTGSYTPLLWESKYAGQSVFEYGRQTGINGQYPDYVPNNVPYSKGGNDSSVLDTGTIRATQAASGRVTVTVSGYKADMDKMPYHNIWDVADNASIYDPKTGLADRGVFATGELWFVLPRQSLADGRDVLDEFSTGDGDMQAVYRDGGMQVTGMSGAKATNGDQTRKDNDQKSHAVHMKVPGAWDSLIWYTSPTGSWIEKGTASDEYQWGATQKSGSDTVMVGSPVDVTVGQWIDAGQDGNVPVIDVSLVKFEPDRLEYDDSDPVHGRRAGGVSGFSASTYDKYVKRAFAVKTDGTSWKSRGEMIRTGYRSLEYYDDYDAAVASGKTVVGVLLEVTRSFSIYTHQYMAATVPLRIREGASLVGQTAVVSYSGGAYTRDQLRARAEAYLGKGDGDAISDDEWERYAASVPNVSDRSGLLMSEAPRFTTHEGTYTPATYDEDGYYRGGETGSGNYGDTLLIVGEEARVSSATAQRGTDGKAKSIYDMDYDERTADLLITPTLRTNDAAGGDGLPTMVTVTTTLPAKASYVPDSAYLGGTYAEATPDAGKVTGGTKADPQVTKNADGTTTLRWDVRMASNRDSVPPIHVSVSIGTPGDEDADVQNGDQLTVTTSVQSTYDREVVDATRGNLASTTIRISKLRASSLSVVAMPRYNDIGDELTFDSRAGNFGNQATADAYAVSLMPYQGGETQSAYDGTYSVTSMVLSKDGIASNADVAIYATTDTRYRRAKAPQDIPLSEVRGWTRLTLDAATGKVTVPAGMAGNIVAWGIVKGSLPAGEQMRVSVSIKPTGNRAGNRYTTLWSDGKNTVKDSVYVVSRSVSGVVWDDANRDGVRQAGEPLLKGVTVSVTDAGGKVVTDLDGTPATAETGDDGAYSIGSLPAGTLSVRAAPKAAGGWDGYEATDRDAGKDDTVDSDGSPSLSGGKLASMSIAGLEFPTVAKMASNVFSSEHNDFGIRVVPKSGLSIDKTYDVDGHEGDAGYKVRVGDVIRYKAKVTNTGNIALAPVTVTDEKTDIKNKKVADSLAPGKSVDGIDLGTYTVTQADIDAGKDIENTAYAHGEPPAGVNPPEDPHDTVQTPPDSTADIAITKTNDVKGHEGNVNYKAKVGDIIAYKVTITNTGTTTLAPVSVRDPFLGIDGWKKVADSLAPGKSVTLTDLGTYTVTQADVDSGKDIVNTAYAHGEPPAGVEPPEDPRADTPRPVAGEPRIDVVKTASMVVDANGNGKYDVGDEVGYAVRVTNTGSLTLTDVTIDDALLGVKGMKVADTMAPGDSIDVPVAKLPAHTITAAEALAGRVDNTVTATGRPPRGNPPTDDDKVTITTVMPKPALAIKKVATVKPKDDDDANGTGKSGKEQGTASEDGASSSSASAVKVGDVIEYSAVVTNTGNVDLAPVSVSDAMLGLDGKVVLPSIAAGKSASVVLGEHVVTQADVDAGKVVNDASAHGVPPEGIEPPEDPTDEVVTTIEGHPGIRVEKTASLSKDADGDGIGDMGDVITYGIKVTNTGSLTLADVRVDDDMLGISDLKVADNMAPGETVEIPADDVPTHTITVGEAYAGKVVNGVDAKGTPPSGDDVTAHDEVETPTHEPVASLTIKKSASVRGHEGDSGYAAKEGDVIDYFAHVENTGTVTLIPVSVSDAMLGVSGKKVADSLAPGAGVDVALGSHEVTADDARTGKVVNEVSAHGVPPEGVRQPEDPTDAVETPTRDMGDGVASDLLAQTGDGGLDGGIAVASVAAGMMAAASLAGRRRKTR